VEIACGNCGKVIRKMIKLRSLKDCMHDFCNKCPSCGKSLSVSDFTLEVEVCA
jgi:predicted RNA-binding Zn-ribbon protein involved in translation (DUF1610 family)